MNKFEEFINTELPIKKELQKIFEKVEPSVIFDIGACEGEDSIRYSNLFKTATIYSFEPLPDNYNKCLKNFIKYSNDRIKPFQLALSSSDSFAKFYVSSGNPEGVIHSDWDYGNKSSSLYPPDSSHKQFEWLKFEKQIKVKTQTISSFCIDQSIQKIDFIHMDVQGAELEVLKGAGNKLKTIKAIWLEVENISMYKGQPLRKDIEKFMRSSKFFKIIDTAFRESGDQLYLNNLYYSNFELFIIKMKINSIINYSKAKIVMLLRSINIGKRK
jgi:FkbM family methyltransferase